MKIETAKRAESVFAGLEDSCHPGRSPVVGFCRAIDM